MPSCSRAHKAVPGCDGSQEEVQTRAVKCQRAELIDIESNPLIFTALNNNKRGLLSLPPDTECRARMRQPLAHKEPGQAGRRAPGGVAEPLVPLQGICCSRVSGCCWGSGASSAIGWTPMRS